MSNPVFNNGRKTLGLLLDNLSGGYGLLFWGALMEACEREDLNLVIFPGESIHARKEYAYQQNVAYQFIQSHTIDGLIMLTNTLTNFVDSQYLKRIYAICSILCPPSR